MTHDHAGNLTGDGLFQYQYDAWNRLTGVWYADGDMSQAAERVARYRYDGLSRRVWKQVTNQGEGVVYHSDDDGVTGIQAGDRHEHYFYSGWRLVETTNHVNGLISGVYDYAASYVLNQFVYGTQYIDEPVRYDRNLQPSAQNRTCIGTGGEDLDASYFYHQDANYRVVMLTDEDGYVVERTTFAAYGEPTVHGGVDSGVAAELGNTLLASTVGNPFLHQGLFRDRESLSYQNRFRQYDSRSGRFMQRDPLYADVLTAYEYLVSHPLGLVDPLGLDTIVPQVIWDVLNTGEAESKKDGLETGGVVVVKKGRRDARRAVKKDANGTELRTGKSVELDLASGPDEELAGGWHTHPTSRPGGYDGFSDEDIMEFTELALLAKESPKGFVPPGALKDYLRVVDGKTYVAKITDAAKAIRCGKMSVRKKLKSRFECCKMQCTLPTPDQCYEKCVSDLAKYCGISIEEGREPRK